MLNIQYQLKFLVFSLVTLCCVTLVAQDTTLPDAKEHFERAVSLARQADWDAVASELKEASLLGRAGGAVSKIEQADWDALMLGLNEGIRRDPKNAQGYRIRGHLRMRVLGLLSFDIDKMFRQKPHNDVDFYFHQGKGPTARKKDYDQVIADCSKAIKLDPNMADAYFIRGGAYWLMGKYDRSISDCTEAIRLDPDNVDAYFLRNFSHSEKELFDLALADINVFINKLRNDLGIWDSDEVVNINPNLATAYFLRGNAYAAKSDFDSAIRDYTQSLTFNPNDAPIYLMRGHMYGAKQDNDSALADFNEAINIDPSYGDAYRWRGFTHSAMGNFDDGIEDFNEALRLNPDLHEVYFLRGSAYDFKKDLDNAIADYTQAIKFDPKDHRIYFNRGDVYLQKYDYENAIADFTKFIKLKPDIQGLVNAYFKRSLAYIKLGKMQKAKVDYENANKMSKIWLLNKLGVRVSPIFGEPDPWADTPEIHSNTKFPTGRGEMGQ